MRRRVNNRDRYQLAMRRKLGNEERRGGERLASFIIKPEPASFLSKRPTPIDSEI
jgi:hypothetical protein